MVINCSSISSPLQIRSFSTDWKSEDLFFTRKFSIELIEDHCDLIINRRNRFTQLINTIGVLINKLFRYEKWECYGWERHCRKVFSPLPSNKDQVLFSCFKRAIFNLSPSEATNEVLNQLALKVCSTIDLLIKIKKKRGPLPPLKKHIPRKEDPPVTLTPPFTPSPPFFHQNITDVTGAVKHPPLTSPQKKVTKRANSIGVNKKIIKIRETTKTPKMKSCHLKLLATACLILGFTLTQSYLIATPDLNKKSFSIPEEVDYNQTHCNLPFKTMSKDFEKRLFSHLKPFQVDPEKIEPDNEFQEISTPQKKRFTNSFSRLKDQLLSEPHAAPYSVASTQEEFKPNVEALSKEREDEAAPLITPVIDKDADDKTNPTDSQLFNENILQVLQEDPISSDLEDSSLQKEEISSKEKISTDQFLDKIFYWRGWETLGKSLAFLTALFRYTKTVKDCLNSARLIIGKVFSQSQKKNLAQNIDKDFSVKSNFQEKMDTGNNKNDHSFMVNIDPYEKGKTSGFSTDLIDVV